MTTWLDVQALAAVSVDAGIAVSDAHGTGLFRGRPGPARHPIGGVPVTYAITPARNELPAYLWDENDTCLPAGSTELTLQGAHAADLMPDAAIDSAGR